MTSKNTFFAISISVLLFSSSALTAAPTNYDLRDYNRSTSVKNQTGGTCWTFGTMGAVESNLLTNSNWTAAGEAGEPDLAEYHLDWWNGFNEHNNDDTTPTSGTGNGLEVHQGGDYRVSSAYITRGEGAVRNIDGQSYNTPPARNQPDYHHYYVRDVEWFVAGDLSTGLAPLEPIKTQLMTYGAIGTCVGWSGSFYDSGDGTFYQEPSSTFDPNHSVLIVGWDDSKTTQASDPGAWLCKNSWGSSWGAMNDGHFWVSYYDKYATQHDQMGAVSYRGAELSEYTNTYFHDYHGWRETLETADSAFNAFTAESDDPLSAVSFYTSEDDVAYTVTIYGRFENGELLDPLATASDTIERTGYHTVDLAQQVAMQAGDDFYVQVSLSSGGQAIDWTSDVPVLLGAPAVTDGTIVSDASAGESYYLDGAIWKDLYDLPLNNSEIGRDVTGSANFCIRAMSEVAVPEPSAVVLLLLGAFGLLAIKRREN